MINKKRLISLVQRLIRINSENPSGNEFAIAHFVKDYLKGFGLASRIYEFAKNRSNVVACLAGRNSRRSLLITPHLDTVPKGGNWHYDPFAAVIKGTKLYGLGATDCKVNLAVSMEVLNSLLEDGVRLDYDLIFAATADEESGSGLGLELLLSKKILKADAALVLDADDFHVIVAQKGLIHLKIKVKGKRAHGAYPWLGVNAIDTALEILEVIKEYRFRRTRSNRLKSPTINIGTIHGGDKVNMVADWCEVELDIRFLPGDSSGRILRDIKDIIAKCAKNAKIEIEGIQDPFEIDSSHPLVKCLLAAMKENKVVPRISGSEGATTISFFQKQGIASLATGFGTSGCAHKADEYVEIENLYKGSAVLETFLRNMY